MDTVTTLLEQAIKDGAIIVIAGVVLGELLKQIPYIKGKPNIITFVNILAGAILGATIPAVFTGIDIISQCIMGGACGLISGLVYDKILKPFKEMRGKDE